MSVEAIKNIHEFNAMASAGNLVQSFVKLCNHFQNALMKGRPRPGHGGEKAVG